MKESMQYLKSKTFQSKEDIKPWLSEYMIKNNNTKIVIERSDKQKIIFKCKKGRQKQIPYGKTRRQITCPFKIRANFSNRAQLWNLSVINENHNHDSIDNIDSTETGTETDNPTDITDLTDNPTDDELQTDHTNVSHPDLSINEMKKRAGHVKNKESVEDKDELLIDYHDVIDVDKVKKALQVFDLTTNDNDELSNAIIYKFQKFLRVELNDKINDSLKMDIVKRIIHESISTYKQIEKSEAQNQMDEKLWFPSNYNNNYSNGFNNGYNNNMVNYNNSYNNSYNNNYSSIPLSPLLNDDIESNTNQLDITLPGINTNLLTPNKKFKDINLLNGFVFPNQLMNTNSVSQVSQNQQSHHQLPPFNSIQNNLPLSPNSSSILPNPANNSTTLNPSSLDKKNMYAINLLLDKQFDKHFADKDKLNKSPIPDYNRL
ncbi:hypothetical protein CLIB1444_03S10462 [[Candida] jaroonii]|uniref:Uncharacterized protein n=1 Tax=[Candida] jaroonii TaxID=467808 RepID=A0ACA9Y5W7_9ASCO|nr:hypothetical protein CLIB1444_03S10462 [[Candida] jaroonii]